MSSRIVPLAALSVMLLVIFWAVVATAQQPGAAPVNGQFLPIQPGDLQGGQPQQQFGLVGPVQPGQQQPGFQPVAPPQAPFQLTPQEEQFVDRILDDWQAVSSRVKTLKADFTLYDYNSVFNTPNPGEPEQPIRTTEGTVRYAAPDKGHYETKDGEKWVCTGTAIFEFNKQLQKVREYRLPPQLQGQAISDGPMPFVFGVEKLKMKNRYWLRVITPANATGQQVWLEAHPKLAKDAASFQRIEVILDFKLNADGTVADLQPFALNLIRPNGKERSAYAFRSMEVNSLKNGFLETFGGFVRPSTPSGWTHELTDDGSPEPAVPGQVPGGPPPGAGGIGAAPLPVVPR